jgi:signal transduction histidine kinase
VGDVPQTTPALEEVQEQHLSTLFRSFAKLRASMMVLPFSLGLWLVVFDPARWRAAILLSIMATALTIVLLDERAFRSGGLKRVGFVDKISLVAIPQMLVIFATGALESPLLPTALPVALVLGAFTTRRRRLLMAWQFGCIWVLYAFEMRGWLPDLIPHALGGGHRAGHNDTHLLVSAVLDNAFLAMGWALGSALGRTYRALVDELFRTRDDALRLHEEQAQLLTTLSAEIAHELKNPLASIKGLAALTSKELDGKNAERMTVLRREADRMQGILDEFLDFSRPLGALAAEPVDLGELCAGVVALHEGMAHERGVAVQLRVENGTARVHCDARKVKQIMINLLQNALDASGTGGVVELEAAPERGGVRLRVLDRGAGLDPSVAARAFDAGVTTKPSGSGLGLTVARAIARQHGGELSLASRAGGGCAAELVLPGGAS